MPNTAIACLTRTARAVALLPFMAAIPAAAQSFSVVHSFAGGADGCTPASLTAGSTTLYGVVNGGGARGGGALFSYTPATRHEVVVWSFPSGSGGIGTPLVVGNLLYGGVNRNGTGVLYSLDPATASFTTLYTFNDGATPSSLVDVNGVLYGTSPSGGKGHSKGGLTFRYDIASRALTVLHVFHDPGGYGPVKQLLPHGPVLYGSTELELFRMNASTGHLTLQHVFDENTEGAFPASPLFAYQGLFYGMNGFGVSDGTLFSVKP